MHRSEFKQWDAGVAPEPTWRDGLSNSDRTYLILAVPRISRNGYRAIVYGRFSGTSGKLKFYPTPESLGFDRRMLRDQFGSELDRSESKYGYVRYANAGINEVKALLSGLLAEDWVVCPIDQLEDVLTQERGRDTSRTRHPMDDEFVPAQEPSADAGGLQPITGDDHGGITQVLPPPQDVPEGSQDVSGTATDAPPATITSEQQAAGPKASWPW